MGVVNMLGVFIFMLAGIIVGGLILIIEWIIATCKDIDKWNPQVRGVVFLDRFILYLTIRPVALLKATSVPQTPQTNHSQYRSFSRDVTAF